MKILLNVNNFFSPHKIFILELYVFSTTASKALKQGLIVHPMYKIRLSKYLYKSNLK